jgi:hypothetical protein
MYEFKESGARRKALFDVKMNGGAKRVSLQAGGPVGRRSSPQIAAIGGSGVTRHSAA